MEHRAERQPDWHKEENMDHTVISIESPVKYYDFKDQHGDILATLRFVPSDIDIFDRAKEVYGQISAMEKEVSEIQNQPMSDDAALEIKNKYAKEIKDSLDRLFHSDTSGFFEIAGPFTPMENGNIWVMVLVEKAVEIIREVMPKNMQKVEQESNKYLEKYKAAPGKYPFPTA